MWLSRCAMSREPRRDLGGHASLSILCQARGKPVHTVWGSCCRFDARFTNFKTTSSHGLHQQPPLRWGECKHSSRNGTISLTAPSIAVLQALLVFSNGYGFLYASDVTVNQVIFWLLRTALRGMFEIGMKDVQGRQKECLPHLHGRPLLWPWAWPLRSVCWYRALLWPFFSSLSSFIALYSLGNTGFRCQGGSRQTEGHQVWRAKGRRVPRSWQNRMYHLLSTQWPRWGPCLFCTWHLLQVCNHVRILYHLILCRFGMHCRCTCHQCSLLQCCCVPGSMKVCAWAFVKRPWTRTSTHEACRLNFLRARASFPCMSTMDTRHHSQISWPHAATRTISSRAACTHASLRASAQQAYLFLESKQVLYNAQALLSLLMQKWWHLALQSRRRSQALTLHSKTRKWTCTEGPWGW